MKTNMININHKEANSCLYKCHFCRQNIDVHGIEKHFATFHNFKSSLERDYVCEFCDDFEEFHSQTNLFHHIQNTHNLINEEIIQSEEIANVDTLEEGKSRFVQLIMNFNSQEDVFNLLQWIKCNDTNAFITNHQDIENKHLIVIENVSKINKEDDNEENILHEETDNTDSNSLIDLDQETDVILTEGKIVYDLESYNVKTFKEDYNKMSTKVITLHECEECKKSFSTGQALKQHINTIHDDSSNENHKCHSCDKSFSKSEDLKRHTYKYHDGKDLFHKVQNDYKCESCTKLFAKAEHLWRHIHTVHKGHKDHKCDSCGKSFITLQTLERHCHTVHDRDKDHKCESCNKSFSRAEYLKMHIYTIHEGHKDYKCESCGKSFSHSHQLKRHIHTIHEGHKDYKCESCAKSFSQLVHLKRHILTVHEGHKDFRCENCGKSFSQAGYLKKHIYIIHHENYGK